MKKFIFLQNSILNDSFDNKIQRYQYFIVVKTPERHQSSVFCEAGVYLTDDRSIIYHDELNWLDSFSDYLFSVE